MKKFIILSLAAVAMMTSCDSKEKQQQEAEQQAMQEATREQLQSAVADRDELLGLVNEISSGMDQIKRLENILAISDGSNETVSQRQQIKADIAAIQQTLQERRQQLDSLESKLSKSTLYNQQLKNTIESLRAQIESQSAEIEQLRASLGEANATIGKLNTQVDSLNTTVATVTDERNVAQQQSVDLNNALNTCYYVVATGKQLKEHKILEGGFLKKTKLMAADFDQSFFVTADKRTLSTIQLNAKKAEVMTSQDKSSYVIEDQGGSKVLKITDPNKFWQKTNYLVVKID